MLRLAPGSTRLSCNHRTTAIASEVEAPRFERQRRHSGPLLKTESSLSAGRRGSALFQKELSIELNLPVEAGAEGVDGLRAA